ncbi:hypothetical protein N7922_24920 (plasmid) [Kosakonia sp. ML.JS2a]|uniref:hypothetical protein n=1 Tax=Kosakonia sp. ML.JS2a TaxID=2980557 RepID=UPI0021D89C41|nr:hypothetical protein [Kosakonia sp. ML.JS2a]UXY13594.1 hypothetical protein N7922_24920 [Kosakonia sp. ML.JS2a]
MNGQTPETDAGSELLADVATLEESLYEFHLRLRDMTKRHLLRDAAPVSKMAGLLIEQIDMQLVELYRRAAEMRNHLG